MANLLEQLFSVNMAGGDCSLHEGQAGFRLNSGCVDNVYTLSEIVQGRFGEDKKIYAFLLDIQKAYDTV